MHINFLIFTPFSDTVLTSSTALLGPSVRGGGYRQSSTSWTLHREELPLSWRSWVHVFSNNIIYLAFSPVICKPTFHLYLLYIVHVFYTLWRAVLCSFCCPCFCPHSMVYYSYPWCHPMAVLSSSSHSFPPYGLCFVLEPWVTLFAQSLLVIVIC